MSPNQVSRARALQLPDDFYAFETHPESRQRHREKLTNEEEAAEDALLEAAVDFAVTSSSSDISLSVVSLSNSLEIISRVEEDKKAMPIGIDQLKAKPGSWECKTCTLEVEANVKVCPACHTKKSIGSTPKSVFDKNPDQAG